MTVVRASQSWCPSPSRLRWPSRGGDWRSGWQEHLGRSIAPAIVVSMERSLGVGGHITALVTAARGQPNLGCDGRSQPAVWLEVRSVTQLHLSFFRQMKTKILSLTSHTICKGQV